MRKFITAAVIAGFLYAGRATAAKYCEILTAPAAVQPSATIGLYLEPLNVSAEVLRGHVAGAGWTKNDDVLVLAAASAMSANDLATVYYSVGYLLYPSHVRLALWCDARASVTQCNSRGAETPQAALARHPVRRVIVVGDEYPFRDSQFKRVNDRVTLVSLR